MRSHIGLLPQCLFIVRSRAKVNRLEESYVSRAAQRPLWGADSTGPILRSGAPNSRMLPKVM